MFVSQKSQYTLRALFELAKRRGSDPITAAEIAQAQAIPPRFLELILQGLRSKGMIDSRRGKQGGYVLNLAPATISVGDIIRSVDGSLAPVECVTGRTPEHCPLRGQCAFLGLWQKAHDALQQVFNSINLQDLVEGERCSMKQNAPLEYCI